VQIIEHRKDIFGSIITTGGRFAFPSVEERAICEKCDEIEETTQRYRRIERTIIDHSWPGQRISRGLTQKDALTRSYGPSDPCISHVSPAAKRDGQIIRVHDLAQL
jgi:hypothetical protein